MRRSTASVSNRSENVPTYTRECDPGGSLATWEMLFGIGSVGDDSDLPFTEPVHHVG